MNCKAPEHHRAECQCGVSGVPVMRRRPPIDEGEGRSRSFKDEVLGPPSSSYDMSAIYLQNAIRDFILHLTEGTEGNLPTESVENTPARFVKALEEMTSGYSLSPEKVLGKVFEDSYDEIVVLWGIPFSSLCEHHLLPFTGTADVGYLPGKVVGLSKLARLVDMYSMRLQIQERMTRQIAEALMTCLDARGAAVVVKGEHSCMSCRGVRKAGAVMVTSTMFGAFRDEPAARAEFLSLCNGG